MNRQPWAFILVRRRADVEDLAGLTVYRKHVAGATVAIAIEMGGDNAEWDAYDEGRVAERILIAAEALGYGAAIGWAEEAEQPNVARFLHLTRPAFVRTIVSIGHPSAAGRAPKSAPGTARKPLRAPSGNCDRQIHGRRTIRIVHRESPEVRHQTESGHDLRGLILVESRLECA